MKGASRMTNVNITDFISIASDELMAELSINRAGYDIRFYFRMTTCDSEI